MALPEQFSLRWNDFHSNLRQGLHSLLEHEELVDVTIAAGGHYMYAHKVILSVASPYFKEIFKANDCEHPIVILKDVEATELKQILQFIYMGEVSICQKDLTSFLQAAEILQVKGLYREDKQPTNKKNDECEEISIQSEWEDSDISQSVNETVSSTPEVNKINNVRFPLKRLLNNTNGKTKKKIARTEFVDDCTSTCDTFDSDNESLHQSMMANESFMKQDALFYDQPNIINDGTNDNKPDGQNNKVKMVKCPSCTRHFVNRYNLKIHIRDKHDTEEGRLECNICNKVMRNRSCLRVHLYHHRKQAALLSLQLQENQLEELKPLSSENITDHLNEVTTSKD